MKKETEGLYIDRHGRPSGSKSGWPLNLEKKVEENLTAENQRLRMENGCGWLWPGTGWTKLRNDDRGDARLSFMPAGLALPDEGAAVCTWSE